MLSDTLDKAKNAITQFGEIEKLSIPADRDQTIPCPNCRNSVSKAPSFQSKTDQAAPSLIREYNSIKFRFVGHVVKIYEKYMITKVALSIEAAVRATLKRESSRKIRFLLEEEPEVRGKRDKWNKQLSVLHSVLQEISKYTEW